MMELDELYEFPEFSRDPTMYLALRNLIVASWHKNCKVSTRLLTQNKVQCTNQILGRVVLKKKKKYFKRH